MLKDNLTSALLKRNLLTQEQLDKALKLQRARGGKLSDILALEGMVDKQELMLILSEELGIPPINLSRYTIDPSVGRLVPRKVAEQYLIIPYSKIGTRLNVAVADPMNVLALDDIKILTGFDLNIVVALEDDILKAIRQCYEESSDKTLERILENVAEQQTIERVEEQKVDIESVKVDELLQDTPVVKLTDMILADAVKNGASDILVEPMSHSVRVRYRVDGLLRQMDVNIPNKLRQAIISRLKVMSNLDIAESRLPQDGRFKIRYEQREIDFRISILPATMGEKAALRILDKSQAKLNLFDLGFDSDSLRKVKAASEYPHGMILICGPTGCGKTTTLYGVLKTIDSPELNMVTVEDPVEYLLSGINQVAIRPEIGLTFASSLRSILRQDPDVIMVGEIRDFETVDIAIKAALTGHLVLSTLHTTTASGAITRLVNMGVEPFLLCASLLLVGAQRLLRRICTKCKESYTPSAAMLAKLGFPETAADVKFYRGKGCPACLHTGYRGRTGILETLLMSPALRALISRKGSETQIKELARQEGMRTLRDNGFAKVLAGETTVEEVIRVTIGDQG